MKEILWVPNFVKHFTGTVSCHILNLWTWWLVEFRETNPEFLIAILVIYWVSGNKLLNSRSHFQVSNFIKAILWVPNFVKHFTGTVSCHILNLWTWWLVEFRETNPEFPIAILICLSLGKQTPNSRFQFCWSVEFRKQTPKFNITFFECPISWRKFCECLIL